jgi:GGDEF domain-containing protein
MNSTTFSEPAFPTRAKLSFGISTSRDGQIRDPEQLMSEAMRNLLHATAGCERGIVARATAETA